MVAKRARHANADALMAAIAAPSVATPVVDAVDTLEVINLPDDVTDEDSRITTAVFILHFRV